ncbi:PTS galactitol transporter subunit IIC [Radiobacillus kanasensis]|uniref:PTS galactitol transporter subunit IIC n=1 Tax=Radiobacillus kanasensis TaxID=2844358 RepID=UPI001E42F13B|nr:PTS transporter subunit IIC [Radiobacillus kanasensis]UFT98597.1 PTS galactitol transporter subunit IIC [Radiobacillus kanasensis]
MGDVLQYFVDLGASVLLPIIIFVFGLILKTKPSQAFRAGLTVGIGFIAINLVIGLLAENLGPAAQQMVNRLGIELSVIDVGWPATSAIAFGSSVGALAIPIGLAVNIALLVFGLTKTLNIDLWNLWHIAFTGALVSIMTGSFVMGLVTCIVHAIVLLVLADLTAKHVAEYYGYPNISFPHGTSTPYYLLAMPLNKLFDRIPGLKNWKADPEAIQKKLGIFGESTIVGLILGIIIGVLAGYNLQETLQLGVATAAVMLLLPRMVSILMEGLAPISEAAGEFVKRRFPGREVYIGMDSALAVGHPAAIASTLILTPIVLLLAIIVPGNKVLPFGDLATLPFIVCMMVPIFRGNVIRTVLAGTIALGFGLLLATYISPLFTEAARNVGFAFPEGAGAVSSLVDGAVPTTALFIFGAKLGYIGLGIIGVLALVTGYFVNRRRPASKQEDNATKIPS